jgi:dephospho-CoA kinase
MIVAITGGIGSGKTTTRIMFEDLGVPTISADVISKEILADDLSVKAAIVNKFNRARVTTDNELDRKKIRTLVFDSDADRQWLEKLMHPIIKEKIKQFAQDCNAAYCIIEIPLLYEAQWTDCVDHVLIVDSTQELQLRRATERDGVTIHDVQKVMNYQLTRKQRLQQDADIIGNTGNLESLRREVAKMHEKYLKLAKKTQRKE